MSSEPEPPAGTPELDGAPDAMASEPAVADGIPTSPLSPRQLLALRIAIVLAILVALLAAGGGVDAAQHTFAHMFPSDVNACGGG